MASWVRHLRDIGLFLLAGLLLSCTERRQNPPVEPVIIQHKQAEVLEAVADVQFDGGDTQVLQMFVKSNSLYLTGFPFGFSRWDIGADAEAPQLTFAASDQLDTFSPYPPLGKWIVDWYASGALTTVGPYALMSGTNGTSIVDMSQTGSPVETYRYPMPPEDSEDILRDEAFVYKAMAVHPTLPYVYGFREQDYVYTLKMSGSRLKLLKKDSYGPQGSGMCCVRGAAVLGDRLYVAFRSRLWVFPLSSGGGLSAPQEIGKFQAYNVASTGNFVYVQHEPTGAPAPGASQPAGIYVFDAAGNQVNYFNLRPNKFTVASDDRHLFANLDNRKIRIFRIRWPKK